MPFLIFTVDTHLFRELGELLVGRDSTALVELIKNAYDADATTVTVHGQDLDDRQLGHIVVQDDGNGMTAEQFREGFLRVASRSKRQAGRRSARLQRHVTGEKGIGRLAAHKLAAYLEVTTVPRTGPAVTASIDWDLVERATTLDDVGQDAVQVRERPRRESEDSGTTIRLSRLRRSWTDAARARFVGEVEGFAPPALLRAPLPKGLRVQHVGFRVPKVRDADASASSFEVELSGDFEVGEDLWELLGRRTDWVVDVRARRSGVQYVSSPTKRVARGNLVDVSIAHPHPDAGPFFDARVLVREGKLSDQLRTFSQMTSGVRVYMEGFRVAPYGERGNDWLNLDYDYTRRSDRLGLLDAEQDTSSDTEDRTGLSVLPNGSYTGAVFLTEEDAPGLRMLVNREGFVPDDDYEVLRQLVRRGIDLNTRARVASRSGTRAHKRARRDLQDRARAATPFATERVLAETLREATEVVGQARAAVLAQDHERAAESIDALVQVVERAGDLSEETISERSLLRVLASVGTQMAAFVHEIEGLVGIAQSVEGALSRIADEHPDLRRRLAPIRLSVEDLRRRIDRQASYLTEVVTVDARRRRSRLNLRQRVETAMRLVEPAAARVGITIENDVSGELRSPPMFSAELTSVFTNLLTNAVKAAGHDGVIRARAHRGTDRRVRVVFENTGGRVEPSDGERWFRPFESTTVEVVDPVLGQGMGLGLPITRAVLEDYRAEIRFVTPSKGFATAVEIAFP